MADWDTRAVLRGLAGAAKGFDLVLAGLSEAADYAQRAAGRMAAGGLRGVAGSIGHIRQTIETNHHEVADLAARAAPLSAAVETVTGGSTPDELIRALSPVAEKLERLPHDTLKSANHSLRDTKIEIGRLLKGGSPEQLLARVDRAQSTLRAVHAHLVRAQDAANTVLTIGRQAGGAEPIGAAGEARAPTSGSTGVPADSAPWPTGQRVEDIAALPAVIRDNLTRYRKKLPAAAEEPRIDLLPGGTIRFESKVPGRVPGSYALYTKTVAADGATISYTKTTVIPDGSIAHVKDKMNP